MKATVASRFGGPEVVSLKEVPEPTVGPRDVLIDVRAASVNPVDAKVRDGALKLILSIRPPMILGFDVAGVVAAVGAEAKRFRVGDEVYGRLEATRMGALAERVAADERILGLKPPSLTFDEAASLPLVCLTAIQCFRENAKLAPGQRVLIHAGAGGLGSAAIQIAKIMGAHVVATASGKNEALVRSLGADEFIDYTKDPLTAHGQVDAVLESIGGETELSSMSACKPGGIVVGVAGLPDLPFARRSMPWFAPAAVWWLTRARRAAIARAGVRFEFVFMRADGPQLEEVARYVSEGKLKPLVHATYPLADVTEAFAELARGRARGKVIVHVS